MIKKLLLNIYDFIWALAHPSFWVMNCVYNPWLEKLLNRIMDERITPKSIDRYQAHFVVDGVDKIIWITNYPYASSTYNGRRPKRRTVKRFDEYIHQF